MILKDVNFDIFIYLVIIALEVGGLVFFNIERPLLFILIAISALFRLTYFVPKIHIWRTINWCIECLVTIALCEWINPIPTFYTVYVIMSKIAVLIIMLLILELRFNGKSAIIFGSNHFKNYLSYMGYEDNNKLTSEVFSDSREEIWNNVQNEKMIIQFPSSGQNLFYYFTKEHEISSPSSVFPLLLDLQILLITDDWNVVKSFSSFYKNLTVVTNNVEILDHAFCRTILYSMDVILDLNNHVDIVIDGFFLNVFNYNRYVSIYNELSKLDLEKKILIVLNKTGFALENFLLNMFKELLFTNNERYFPNNLVIFRFNELSHNDFTRDVDVSNLLCESSMHHLIDVDTLSTSVISGCMNLFAQHPDKSKHIVSLSQQKNVSIDKYIYTYDKSHSISIKHTPVSFYSRFHEEKILDGQFYSHSYSYQFSGIKAEILNNKDLQYLMPELVIFMK
jgi:hypothetical protein